MLKKRRLSRKQQSKHNFSLGKTGEEAAVEFLKKQNYQILETNLSYRNKEIDVVALDEENQELVFVEVKTRETDWFGDPSQAVNYRKLKSMQYVAYHYLKRNNFDYDYRFDTIGIVSGKIQHYQNITW